MPKREKTHWPTNIKTIATTVAVVTASKIILCFLAFDDPWIKDKKMGILAITSTATNGICKKQGLSLPLMSDINVWNLFRKIIST